VGPVWEGGFYGERELLASCYRNLLALAAAEGIRTLAIPAISCGVYRFPLQDAARIAVREIARARDAGASLESISLVAFDDPMLAVLEEAVAALGTGE
jgi:O-acetyl-ADP-ribose deacetylase (regulator of RNase III)